MSLYKIKYRVIGEGEILIEADSEKEAISCWYSNKDNKYSDLLLFERSILTDDGIELLEVNRIGEVK